MQLKESLRKARRPYTSFVYYRLYMPLFLKYLSLSEGSYRLNDNVPSIPPPSLRYKVNFRPEADTFIKTGKRISDDIVTELNKASLDLDSFSNVLDFGCGCGRTLMYFSDRQPRFYGTDVDAKAVEWCKKNLRFAEFDVNDHLPPLRYHDGMFDLILAISVFTHLNEEDQFSWLQELNRVLAKDGILLATFHGKGAWSWLLQAELQDLKKYGFLYRLTNDKKGVLPDWYQTTHHTKEYVMEAFTKNFELLTYSETAIRGFQDAGVFRKR